MASIAACTVLYAVLLSACGGSTSGPTATTDPPSPLLRAALAAWSDFPAADLRRPVVLLGGDSVNAPAQGFADVALKEAFLDGAIAGPASYPPVPTSSDASDLITSQQAFTILATPTGSGPPPTVTLRVTRVAMGTDTFRTDRGVRRFPAWRFWMQGVQNPASVLAVSKQRRFPPPPPNDRPQDVGAATLGHDNRTLLLTFTGPPAGTGPCEANFVASSAESPVAVAVDLRTVVSPRYKDIVCTQIASERHLEVTLVAPVGNRVVVDAFSLMPVPVTKAGA